jgi:hypothetical protein
MIFPYLIAALAFLCLLAYFCRKNVTWTNQKGTQGSVGMAIIVLIVGAGVGWLLDYVLDWSVVPQYMFSIGGVLSGLSIAFFGLYGILCLSMFISATKTGSMVA